MIQPVYFHIRYYSVPISQRKEYKQPEKQSPMSVLSLFSSGFLLYTKLMKERFLNRFSGLKFSFPALIILQTGIFAAVMLLRTVFLLFHTTGIFYWKVFYQRGLPLVIAGAVICLFGILFICIRSREHLRKSLKEDRGKWLTVGILMLIGLAAAILVSKTRLGLEKENAFYGKPTVPLLEWHIVSAFVLCVLCFCADHFIPGGIPAKIKRLIPVMIWLCAVIIWTAIPNQNGFFSPIGRAPNYETYPFSDGSFYGHYARAAAAGMGLKGDDIPPRPLYIAFLTGLHLLSGIRYDRIIFFQTLFLGLLPVFGYLCGRDLHSVSGGLAAALLVILRETHAILAAPFGHNISTTKYFFSDIPTALVCAAFIWLLIGWQKRNKAFGSASRTAFAAGCALGAMALIRTQSLCLLFLLPFPLIAVFRHDPKQALKQLILFALALLICITPWLLRSRRITGQLVFDHPMTQTSEMARSYNFDGADLSQLPGENDGAYTRRMTAFIAGAVRSHFKEIGRFVSIHFLNSEISGFRLFPLRDHLNSTEELLKSREPFWELLDSADLNVYNLLFFGLGYLLWAVGIGASGQRSGQAGFIPLAAILIFNFSTALGRYSAGRYLIPADWIMMLYFAIGFADLLSMAFRVCGGEVQMTAKADSAEMPFVSTIICLLIIAAAIPVCDRLIPQTFVQDPPETVMAETGELRMDCAPKDRMYLHAIAVYPRWYGAGEGEPESAKQGYGAADHGRLVFLTLAPHGYGTIEMPMNQPPEYLPDGAEVRISACLAGPTSIAETLLVDRDGEQLRYEADR